MVEGADRWREVARREHGERYAHRYAARFASLAASGEPVHGEADLLESLAAPGARILDAGCGTGRVAGRLNDRGYAVVGVDADETMIEVARRQHPDLTWLVADLARLSLGDPVDVAILAGNVVPFVGAGSVPAVIARVAAHLVPGGLLVSGFGLRREQLPPGVPPVPLSAYDHACLAAGLQPRERFGGWDRSPQCEGYVVAVHQRPGTGLDQNADQNDCSRTEAV